MKYKKKPVEVEVIQYDGKNSSFIAKSFNKVVCDVEDFLGTEKYLEINTLEGKMKAQVGDYIIQGVQGEIYPCKPDIFEMTYEKCE